MSVLVWCRAGEEEEEKKPREIAARPFFELFELCKCPGLITPPFARASTRSLFRIRRSNKVDAVDLCFFFYILPLSFSLFFIWPTVIVFARQYRLPGLLRSFIASFLREREKGGILCNAKRIQSRSVRIIQARKNAIV